MTRVRTDFGYTYPDRDSFHIPSFLTTNIGKKALFLAVVSGLAYGPKNIVADVGNFIHNTEASYVSGLQKNTCEINVPANSSVEETVIQPLVDRTGQSIDEVKFDLEALNPTKLDVNGEIISQADSSTPIEAPAKDCNAAKEAGILYHYQAPQ